METFTCPKCQEFINVNDALTEPIRQALQAEFEQRQHQASIKLTERENLLKAQAEKVRQQQQDLETQVADRVTLARNLMIGKLREEVAAEQATRLQELEVTNKRRADRIKELEKNELSLLSQQEALQEAQERLELTVAQRMADERKQLVEQTRKQDDERHQWQLQQKEQLVDTLTQQLADMQRKMQQGSQQAQGEIVELALEHLLSECFPHDTVEPVAKGVSGADVLLTVHSPYGKASGRIVFETKRTKAFSPVWIDKLKTDLQAHRGDVAVLVTEALPKDMPCFGLFDGVWVCTFSEVKALTAVLREGILRLGEVRSSEENKGEKMQLLYNYLTSQEFRLHVEAIFGAFQTMKSDLEREKRALKKIWATREKQLDCVLDNTLQFYGSVRGIAGKEIQEIEALELDDALLLDELAE